MVMQNKYAGIGSRSTPLLVLQQIESIAERLAKIGWLLRSGGASGADDFFERGCDKVKGQKEIWLPWSGFNKSTSGHSSPSEDAIKMASEIHPNWDALSQGAQKLHARNCHQVLGWGLDDPVDVVICWTEGGRAIGGTRTALMIAKRHNIRVCNLAIDPIPADLWTE
jgi:hypothetical protein